MYIYSFFFLIRLLPPRSTRTDTLFPYTTLFRSGVSINVVNNLPGAHELIPGINAEYIPSHPHNWILEILVETGWIGLLLVVAILALLAWKITQRLRRDRKSTRLNSSH